MNITKEEKVSFAIRLKQLLRENKMTQEQLAELVGVTPNSVSGWITEKSPLKQNKELILNTIANKFDVDVDYILCKQVEKRGKKSNFNNINTTKLVEGLRKIELYEEFLKLANIEVKILSEPIGEPVEDQEIFEGKIISYTYYEESKESIDLTYEGKTKVLEKAEYEKFMENIIMLTKISATQLLTGDKK